MPNEHCIRCHSILTSEDKHFLGISCHICEEDSWYAEHFHLVPNQAIWRYIRYQLRWLWCASTAALGTCQHITLRWLAGKRE